MDCGGDEGGDAVRCGVDGGTEDAEGRMWGGEERSGE